MDSSRRTFLGTAAGALSVAIAGCTGDTGGKDIGETTEAPPPSTATATSTTAAPTTAATTTSGGSTATVRTRSHAEYGDVLVDSAGMTLYMFDRDTRGEDASACYDGCASAWPPLTVEGTATAAGGVSADVTTFARESGEMQVAANGWPLYYFASDERPGDVAGQGANDVWWVLGPDGTPIKPSSTTTTAPTTDGTTTTGMY